ncbi:MAG: 50S ribosomal protein L23 [Candidatus Nanohaloarchaea archaeon]|nr:50S ribosomal protein L23 [Candidatus Nanohaloarchaea archaeon]
MKGWDLIKYPHLTEKSVEKVDEENTLVFIVEEDSSKPQLKKEMEDMFDIEVSKVNTQITPEGDKKAYIKLAPGYEALDIATRLGML